jgi:hypothetical protein
MPILTRYDPQTHANPWFEKVAADVYECARGVGLGKVDKGGGSSLKHPLPEFQAAFRTGATISCKGRRIAQGP